MAAEKQQLESIESVLKKLPDADAQVFQEIYYGKNVRPMEISEDTIAHARKMQNAEVKAYTFGAHPEQLRASRLVRVGIFQHQTPMATNVPIEQMRATMHKMAHDAITTAFYGHANIFCFQETWNMPFAFCTREKQPWCEYAESATDGPTIKYLQELAKQYNMVIISPILERDEMHCDTIWNTAVVIDNHGDILGKHRKNHIPRVGDFNESTYYYEGNTGHPVFETEFGRIAINICYGRHHPLNWLMFGINGAEIVFNPSATTDGLSEPLWGIEARNAAIANSYFTCAINRVGTEHFQNEFTSANGQPAHTDFGHFYGSSYIAAPNGSRTPGLSRVSNGLLIAEMDLNMCRQVKDVWGFQMTQRLDMYAKSLTDACAPDYERQIIRK